MSAVVAIGDERRLAGYALAGAEVRSACTLAEAEEAFAGLEAGSALLVLTPEAHAALSTALAEREEIVWVVLPS